MGADAGDYDGDGRVDFVLTAFAHDRNTLYRNLDGQQFEDATQATGLAAPTFKRMGWGTAFLDARSRRRAGSLLRERPHLLGHRQVSRARRNLPAEEPASAQHRPRFPRRLGDVRRRSAGCARGPGSRGRRSRQRRRSRSHRQQHGRRADAAGEPAADRTSLDRVPRRGARSEPLCHRRESDASTPAVASSSAKSDLAAAISRRATCVHTSVWAATPVPWRSRCGCRAVADGDGSDWPRTVCTRWICGCRPRADDATQAAHSVAIGPPAWPHRAPRRRSPPPTALNSAVSDMFAPYLQDSIRGPTRLPPKPTRERSRSGSETCRRVAQRRRTGRERRRVAPRAGFPRQHVCIPRRRTPSGDRVAEALVVRALQRLPVAKLAGAGRQLVQHRASASRCRSARGHGCRVPDIVHRRDPKPELLAPTCVTTSSASAPARGGSQRVGTWRMTWTRAASEWRVAEWTSGSHVTSRAARPVFTEITTAALGGERLVRTTVGNGPRRVDGDARLGADARLERPSRRLGRRR